MELKFEDAKALAVEILTSRGMRPDYAGIVADHLIDAAIAGHAFAGLPRVLALVEALEKKPPARPVTIVREDSISAVIDGGDNNGYVTSVIGVDKAIDLAKGSGVGIVGVRNTWFSGRLAYYVERAARLDLVAFHTASSTARVAPYGGIDALFGTNPIALAFPGKDGPLVIDLGTSAATWGELLLRKRTGRKLDPGMAVDVQGQPTDDAAAGLDGAILPWGGPRGGALSLAVQVLGVLAGGNTIVKDVSDYGFFFFVFNPELLMPINQFKTRAEELLDIVRTSRPGLGAERVRIPGASSLLRRAQGQVRGTLTVDDKVYAALQNLRPQS
ncbi:MAG: Ldh family oxidoreductase [Rhizobiales bacterium]|nr:Ldh family oxidoreductase [Hyphomicrobiales bacterium]